MTTVEEHVNSLETYGVTVIEKAISDDLVDRCRKNIIDYFNDKDNWCLVNFMQHIALLNGWRSYRNILDKS